MNDQIKLSQQKYESLRETIQLELQKEFDKINKNFSAMEQQSLQREAQLREDLEKLIAENGNASALANEIQSITLKIQGLE